MADKVTEQNKDQDSASAGVAPGAEKIASQQSNTDGSIPEKTNVKTNSLPAEFESQILTLLTEVDQANETELKQKNAVLLSYLAKLIEMLKEKTNECTNLDKQNTALMQQAKSLKEVITIVKDLLNIRNMELSHLHQDMTSMEEKIKNERVKQHTMIEKMEHAAKLNDNLREEYQKQYDVFRRARTMYEQKIAILMSENRRLQSTTNQDENEINELNRLNEQMNGIELTLQTFTSDDIVQENVEK